MASSLAGNKGLAAAAPEYERVTATVPRNGDEGRMVGYLE